MATLQYSKDGAPNTWDGLSLEEVLGKRRKQGQRRDQVS